MPSMPLSNQPLAPLDGAQKRARLAWVAAIVLTVGGAFVYIGGWLSPRRVTPARIVDEFEHINGVHAGFRRNHAKGVGVSGYFESNGQGAQFSKAVVFERGRVPVVGRFALAGGLPQMADTAGATRSMALSFALPHGAEWRTGMNNMPVFVANSGEGFYDLLTSSSPDPRTGKPNPARVQALLARHPETARALKAIKAEQPSSGFDNSTYNSLNAFLFIDRAGHSTPVRWAMLPTQPFESSPAQPAQRDANFLFEALIARLEQQPLQWHLVLTIAQPGDPTSDATLEWPADRKRVDVGTLVIDHIEGEGTSPARLINFDPLVLPDGIAASDDPLLSVRSAAYARSFTRRAAEPASPSAVTTP